MSARQDDNRRIGEMWHTARQLQRRIEQGQVSERMLLSPAGPLEELVADGVVYSLMRVLEEAVALSDGTKVSFPEVAWDEIRGMRNRLAHDYAGVRLDFVWHALVDDLPELLQLCRVYCERRGIEIEALAPPDEPRA